MFDVVWQCEIPRNIQVISGEAETGDRIPQAEKSDFRSSLFLLHLVGKMQRQGCPPTKPNNIDRPIAFGKVLSKDLHRPRDPKTPAHSSHTTEQFSDKGDPRPDSLQIKYIHIEREAFAEGQHVRLLLFIGLISIPRSIKRIQSIRVLLCWRRTIFNRQSNNRSSIVSVFSVVRSAWEPWWRILLVRQTKATLRRAQNRLSERHDPIFSVSFIEPIFASCYHIWSATIRNHRCAQPSALQTLN